MRPSTRRLAWCPAAWLVLALAPHAGAAQGRYEAVSLLGDTLREFPLAPDVRERYERQLAEARTAWQHTPANADSIIWLGRRLAYLGRIREAIAVYTRGIAIHPKNPWLYRHRGHRWITVREFARAAADLERAAALVKGKPDQVEPDGQPNARNAPIGTLHSNISYHLSLAYYLQREYARAVPIYRKELAAATNDDRRVSTAHWLYMSLRRLGRDGEAAQVLVPIRRGMDVVENGAYHRLLLMYKGELPPDSVLSPGPNGEMSVTDATAAYGIANWHLYNGRRREADELFRRIIAGGQWGAFGYIAAEAELARERATPAKSGAAQPHAAQASVDWPAYGNDLGGQKYSPLADITRENVAKLGIAFSWNANERPIPASDGQKAARPGQFQATPLAIHDTLFFSTPYNRVIALDATSGREFWAFDPQAWKTYGQPSNGTGFVHRGVATWTDGRERRVFISSRWRLIALDAATGRTIAGFGVNGEVDVTLNLSRPVRKEHYTNTSPPVVWGNLVILGNGVGDRLVYRGDPPGDIQAFDVRTGKRVWRFKTVPEAGEAGNETWSDDSWKYEGHTNAWAPFTVDSARGLVYLPVGTPSNDWYGGERKGANLFAETLLCLDARTGKRVWHFQVAHHGLWDYDLPAPPNLVTVMHDGRRVDAVVAPTKQGLLFAFDRVTGKPLWPIEERAVPASDVPGEMAWPTQPFPAKPAPYAKQGFTLDDVIDFTPAVKAAALAEIAKYRLGPMYTPPSLQGSVSMPGAIGGSGWGGAAVDPETKWIYVKATNSPALFSLRKRDAPSDTVDASYMVDLAHSSLGVSFRDGPEGTARGGATLPINKPPYGTLTAIDLNTGDTKWTIPLGDSPNVRNHPALKGVALPEKLGVAGSPGALVTKGGLVFSTGGGQVLYAIDSRTGKTLWEFDLGQVAYANPMTYRTKAGKQYVVIATGAGANAKLVAFGLGGGASP